MEPDGLEDLYKEVHEKIREDPSPAPKKAYKSPAQFANKKKLTHEQRKQAVADKKAARLNSLLKGRAAAEEEDDE